MNQRQRIDRLLSQALGCPRKAIRPLLAAGRVQADGVCVRDIHQVVDAFTRITVDGQVLQARTPLYLMLHKPKGCASATQDPQHPTVLDLIDAPFRDELHIAGRLDFNTTGLLLLTNDGGWSRLLTDPQHSLPKVYLVTTEDPIEPHYADVFAQGIYFAYENLTTRPAQLQILDTHHARLTLMEGRYHQVKRMFGHFNNKVLALHRERIGGLALPDDLAPGHWRALTADDMVGIGQRQATLPSS